MGDQSLPGEREMSCLAAVKSVYGVAKRAFVVALFGSFITIPAHADDNGIECSCVANGQRVELGKTACIRTSSGKEFLARCERFLNNTSWTRLQDGCPSVSNQAPDDKTPEQGRS